MNHEHPLPISPIEKDRYIAELFNASREQPAWDRLTQLLEKSRYDRKIISPTRQEIRYGNETFTIQSVETANDPDLPSIQSFMAETFGEDEVDPIEVTAAAVEGRTPSGAPEDVTYRIFTLKNENGEIVSLMAGGLLNLRDENGEETGEAVYMVGYAITRPDMYRKGLGGEVYCSALLDATLQAENTHKRLRFAVGECVHSSEKFWNSVSWRRAYIKNQGGLAEVKYIQPPLDFEDDGSIAEGAGSVAEHLMVDDFNNATLTGSDIIKTVQAIYRWCNEWKLDDFDGDATAHKKHLKHSQKEITKLRKTITQGSEVVLLSQLERTQQMQQGLTIKEHTDADRDTVESENM